MGRKALLNLGLLGAAALVYACVAETSSDPVASTQSPIEGGVLINDSDNPVSSEFPRSTVFLLTTITRTDGSTFPDRCTGVIVSPTQLLTAAHCRPNTTTVVQFYPTKPNAINRLITAQPIGSLGITVVSAISEATFGASGFPWACNSGTCSSTNGTYADLAIVNLSGPVPAPYHAVPIFGPGLFWASIGVTDAWQVGVGKMNVIANGWDASSLAVQNPNSLMEWVAWRVSEKDGGQDDSQGFFKSASEYCDHGDSGGPVFEWNFGQDAGFAPASRLILVGIDSAGAVPTPEGWDNDCIYTSVQNPVNYAWVQKYLQGAPPGTGSTATFGASQ